VTARLSSTVVERIDEICDRFEADWKAGRRPRVDDYLSAEVGPEREALRWELLRVDAHYRGRADAGPTVVCHTVVPLRDRPFVAGYEVLGELGRGGMSVVYQAQQLRPNRLVALKMISAGTHASARELERFRSEADAIAQLQHPHIVQVYEVGEQDGCPYFALEYVAGGSLDRYLAGMPQPPQAAAVLVERLAHAIHHAHQRGVIHRDLKPANVLLQLADSRLQNEAGHVVSSQSASCKLQAAIPKITDFGLAKLLRGDTGAPTQSGDVLGTPSYMAPEQVGGSKAQVSAATDVYGLGAILYELLTGRPPFRAETALETMLQVQTVEPVSPSRLQPKCPRDLVTICLKCLSKQARQRYASGLELAEDLRRFLDGQSIRARPVGPLRQVLKWTRRQPVVAGLGLLLLLAVTLGVATGSWFWWRAEEGLKTAEEALEKERAAQAARVATLDRYQVALAHREWLANNVKRAEGLLDACSEDQRQSWEWRYLDRVRRSALHTFAGHHNTVQAVAIHPLGRKVVSASHDASVRLWDLDTGRGKVLGNHQYPVLAVAFSPDGGLLASSGSRDGLIKLWDVQTGAALPGLAFGGKGDVSVWGLAFDPGSRYLAAGGPKRVKVWDTRDQKWVYDHTADAATISQVVFSPDGRYLATASRKLKVWDWAAKAKKPLHEWQGHEGGTHDLAFSPDGNWLASGGRDGLVRVHSLRTGQEEFTLNAHQLSVTSVNFSPDGQRLATAGQEGDMHVWNVKERRRLFTLHGHSGAVWDLAFTPDGSCLVSASSDFLVRVWDAAASQEVVTLPFRASGEVSALAYGPGGRFLAWGDVRGQAGLWDTLLHKVVFRFEDPNLKSRNAVSFFAFCPDGRQVAWRQRSGTPKLWDLGRGQEIPLFSMGQRQVIGLAFSTDGKQLLAASMENGKLVLHDLCTGQELLALPRPGTRITQVVWSPDARCFLTLEDRRYARLWATETGRFLGELEHQPSVTCITFSDDGGLLAVGGVAGRMRVWDLAANRETMVVGGHPSNLYGLALSPDGRRLASAASDCTVKLWDAQSGHEVLTLRTQLHEHSRLAFSPDGADLVSVSKDNQLQIWSTRSVRGSP
jgi:WD40 repeat protein/serine/threonine protein kinase